MAKRTRLPQDQGQPEPVALPAAAQALNAHMQELARQFISRRRQLGVELLEAARLLAEARVFIMHGQWQLFLDVTGTGPDTAESLLNIHRRGIGLPDYAAAICGGRLSESVAWRLAQPSVPPEAVTGLLNKEQPLTVEFVEQQLRSLRRPRRAESASRPPGPEPSAQEEQIPPHGGIRPPTSADPGPSSGFSGPLPGVIVSLSDEDWGAAQRLTELLEGCATGEELLSPMDWAVQGPLAEVLGKIRRQRF